MSAPRSYNLLCESWIPVVWRDDATERKEPKIGIREALERAPEIRCISHTSPFIEFGLYRILITIVLDAYIDAGKRPTIGNMRQMLESGEFDAEVISGYLEKYRSGFELWGNGQRFLQVQTPDCLKKDQRKSVTSVFSAIPSGTSVVHWHHLQDKELKVSAEAIAGMLASVSPFNFMGKFGEVRTLVGDPPLYALPEGGCLFETIALNLPRPSGRITLAEEMRRGPAWRTPMANLPRTPTLAEGFTWPVRKVALLQDQEPLTEAYNASAYNERKKEERAKLGRLFIWRDPNGATESSERALDHVSGRAEFPVWRDAIPLLLISAEGDILRAERPWLASKSVVRRSRPEVVTNALRILEGRSLRVAVYGMKKKQGDGGGDMKVEEWFRSVLSFPAEIARDERLSAQALDAFKTAQRVADATRTAIRMLRPKRDALPRQKVKLNEVRRQEGDRIGQFWQALEPVLAHSYLDDLAVQNPDARKTLNDRLRSEARAAFRAASDPQRRSADGLFRIANASNYLERRLGQTLKDKNS